MTSATSCTLLSDLFSSLSGCLHWKHYVLFKVKPILICSQEDDYQRREVNLENPCALSLKRNTTFLHGFFLGPRVRVMWPWIMVNQHIGFLNNLKKNASKNMKRFSDYPSKTERISSLWFRKTVNSLLVIMYFWFFMKQVKDKHTSLHYIHLLLTIGTCLHMLNTFLARWPRNIKQFRNDNHISERMSGNITGGTQISDFSEIIMPSNKYDSLSTFQVNRGLIDINRS